MDVEHELFRLLRALDRPFANVVQVGANTGQEVAAFQHYGVDWAIMIEPLDEPFRRLGKRSRGLERYIPVQALCSSREGALHEFHVASNKGLSSSLLAPARHLDTYPHVAFPTRLELVSTTVDAVVAQVLSDHPELTWDRLDTLMMDVQGAELQVLQGAPVLLRHARQIYTEVSGDHYQGGATLEDLQACLLASGFQLQHVRQDGHGMGDALFVKTAR